MLPTQPAPHSSVSSLCICVNTIIKSINVDIVGRSPVTYSFMSPVDVAVACCLYQDCILGICSSFLKAT